MFREQPTLNKTQVEQVVEWLAAGYTDNDILTMIERRREKSELLEDNPWPRVGREVIKAWRKKYSELATDIEARSFDVAIGTGLATRTALAKRLSGKAGQMEMTINRLLEEIESLIDQGVLTGVPHTSLGYDDDGDEDDDVFDADYLVDGQAVRRLPARRKNPRYGNPDNDPRYVRIKEMMALTQGWIKEWRELLKQIHALNPSKTNDDDETQKQRTETATRLLEDLKKAQSSRAGAFSRRS